MDTVIACWNQVTAGRAAQPDVGRELEALRLAGWPSVELWLDHWDAHRARHGDAGARHLLDDSGLHVAGACFQEGLFFARGPELTGRLGELDRRLEQCGLLGAPCLVVIPLPAELERPSLADLELAAENVRRAAERAEPYGVSLTVEFLRGARLVNNLPSALHLAAAVDRADVGVLVDTYQLYAGPSKLEDLDLLSADPSPLRFVHVTDLASSLPRELWTDAERVLPGAGVLPLRDMFARLGAAGYAGPVSLELFSAEVCARWAEDPVETARAALRSVVALWE